MRRTKTYLSDCSISLLTFTKARACKSIRSPVTVKTEIPKRKQNTSSLIIVAKTCALYHHLVRQPTIRDKKNHVPHCD